MFGSGVPYLWHDLVASGAHSASGWRCDDARRAREPRMCSELAQGSWTVFGSWQC